MHQVTVIDNMLTILMLLTYINIQCLTSKGWNPAMDEMNIILPALLFLSKGRASLANK